MICDVSKYIDKCYIIGSRTSLSCECQFELNRLCLPKSKVKYIQYTLNKSFTDLKYFKKEGILQALRDACKNNYKKVLILADDFLLINDSGFDYYFKHHCADILILNPKDIVKDCFLVDSKALEFMSKKDHPYNIFDVDTSQYNWWDDLYYQWVEYLMVASVQDDLLAHKIDYVLTYVDSNDPVWKAEYNKYKNEAPSNKENRWRDWDNFVFNLRGIAKNLPWINNVYIIVSSKSQVPSWIKNVIIVEHKEIIPSEFLPTFNSCTIESYICNIPGLSEYFIYGNDDTFILNPVKKTDFFNNGKIVCNFKNIKDDKSNFNHTCVNSFRFCMGDFNRYHINMLKKRDTKLKMQYHTPHPIIKSTGLHLYKRYQGKINSYATRFRSENINQYIYGDYEYIMFNTEESKLSYKYININECIESFFKTDLLCLNDNQYKYDNLDFIKKYINRNFYNIFNRQLKYDNYNITFNRLNNILKGTVSIIVPVYNAEKYLDKCLTSIVNQTYKNLEILLINDGSTDKSLDICKKYANNDKRIKIINKQNEGVSKTRNLGLSLITGEWFCFVDADDYVDPYRIEIPVNVSILNNADVVQNGFNIFINDKVIAKWIYPEGKYYITDNKLLSSNKYDIGHSANKLYKTSSVLKSNTKFTDCNMCEDTIFNMELYTKLGTWYIISDALYYYRKEQGSLSQTPLSNIRKEKLKISLINTCNKLENDINTKFNFGYLRNNALLFLRHHISDIRKLYNKKINIKKMNIISNDCTGAFIYMKNGDAPYNNPFMWSTILHKDFKYLLENYDNINYDNFNVTNTILSSKYKNTFTIVIDDCMNVNYIHYIQNDDYNTPTRISSTDINKRDQVGLYYNDMKTYIGDEYIKHVNRLHNNADDPIFILTKGPFYTNEEFLDILYLKTKYEKMAVVPYNFKYDQSKVPNNTKIIQLSEDVINSPTNYADYIIKYYYNFIYENN